MMINELPQTFNGIAETFFENSDDRSKFLKDLQESMRMSAGIGSGVTNERIAEVLNDDRDNDLYLATEKNLTINPNSPDTRKNILNFMNAWGQHNKAYPESAVEDAFVDNYIADYATNDENFKINAINTDVDYTQYLSRNTIFFTKLLDKLENDNPSLWSIAKRIGVPIGLGMLEIGKAASKKTFLAHGLTAAYDVSQLGDTIYNTQKKFNDRLYSIVDNKNLDQRQFIEECDKLLEDVMNIPEEYRYDIYKSLWEGPSLYADAGLSFSGFGVGGLVHGFNALKNQIKNFLPSYASSNIKNIVYNEELGKKVIDLATNGSNEERAAEAISKKYDAKKKETTTESELNVAKGVEINKDYDKNLRGNSNKDLSIVNTTEPVRNIDEEWKQMFGDLDFEKVEQGNIINDFEKTTYQNKINSGMDKKQALIETTNESIARDSANLNTSDTLPKEPVKKSKRERAREAELKAQKGEIRLGTDESTETTTTISGKGVEINKDYDKNLRGNSDKDVSFFERILRGLSGADEKTGSSQKGEIRLERPEQSYFIDHGKGVNGDQPLTYEEAVRLIKQLSGRKGLPEISAPNINIESDYVAISTASKVPWGPEEIPAKAKHLPRTGEGTEMYGSGIYASFIDDNEASRALYYKNFEKELENEYIRAAKDKNIYAVDNPYFWYKNAQSTLTKDEEAIIKDIANSYNKDLLNYDVFDDAYKGIDFNTQLVASEGTLKSNLDFVKGSLEEAIKEYKKDPSLATAQHYVQLIAERNMLENIIKYRKKHILPEARLYTHSIKNPNKYPEKYLRFYVTGNDKRVGKIIPELHFHNANIERLKEQEEWIRYVFEKAVKKKNEEYWRAPNPFMQQKIDDDLDKLNEALRGKDYDIDTWYSALKSAYSDYRDIGIDGLIHSDTNIVIFNKDAVMPVNKLEKGVIKKEVSDVHTQIGYNNAHMIVSAGEGVGYFVRELHGVENAKPMIIKNYKVLDMGDYKPYNK